MTDSKTILLPFDECRGTKVFEFSEVQIEKTVDWDAVDYYGRGSKSRQCFL